ncbi:MAG TPA: di-trans,poly-cis-decaprenylcistransferase, partial [Actinobacteria bacterium]|nr:di-trans,poly-cis-decaprenylcistransferase [Actinomycetes bacterium]HEX21063.1 di-trans,poly-cis-decaprenylcistransferase [Actinomycetota bacterium]
EIAEDPRTHQRRMKIKSLGKFDLLPVSTQKVLTEAEYATKDYDNFHLNIAIGYGGRQEIADALRELILSEELKGKTIDEIAARITPEAIGEHLYTVDLPDPELIIRTSGETRLSGFLLWQSAYSEYYFCDAFWPAFREIDFLRAIRSYQQRRRRFGL